MVTILFIVVSILLDCVPNVYQNLSQIHEKISKRKRSMREDEIQRRELDLFGPRDG